MSKRYLIPEEVMLALKEGKTIKSEQGYTYELIKDNFIVQTFSGKIRSINTTIFFDTNYYIEEPEPLKIEVGKFYRTRRGDKVVCLCQRGDYYIHRLNSYIVGYWVDKTGRALFNGAPEMTETDSDVVALWEDEHK